MEITGKVVKIFDEKQVSASFKKRELVIKTNEQYPQVILMEMVQDKIKHLDGVNVGDSVNVHVNIRGREWKSPEGQIKYFNTLEAWRLTSVDDTPAESPQSSSAGNDTPAEDDDLPF